MKLVPFVLFDLSFIASLMRNSSVFLFYLIEFEEITTFKTKITLSHKASHEHNNKKCLHFYPPTCNRMDNPGSSDQTNKHLNQRGYANKPTDTV